MTRWLPALIAALCIHGLLFFIPVMDSGFPVLNDPSRRTIRVQLKPAPPEEQKRDQSKEKKPAILKRPFPARPIPEPKPVPIPLPEKNSGGKNQTTAPEKTVAIAATPLPVLQAGSRKKQSVQADKNKPAAREQADNQLTAAAISQESPQVSTSRSQSAIARNTTAVPLYRQNKKPVYPLLARKRGWQGTAILEVTISAAGLPMQVVLLKSSSYALLDKSARKAVQSWRFTPALRNGQPVAVKVQVPVQFTLE